MLGTEKDRIRAAHILGAFGGLLLLPFAPAMAMLSVALGPMPSTAQAGGSSPAGTHSATPATFRPLRKTHPVRKTAPDPKAVPTPTLPVPVAVIHLQGGRLTIDANRADLTQILNKVSAAGGMAIEGVPASQPIFGTYGPGRPNAVLTELLTGSGENFMMVGGGSGGFPKKLILTQKGTMPLESADKGKAATVAARDAQLAAGSSAAPQEAAQGSADGSVEPDGEAEPLGPGAIAHVPPNEVQGSADDSNARAQQNLQRLEKMQAQQQQTSPQ
jgi:hypothetical protein